MLVPTWYFEVSKYILNVKGEFKVCILDEVISSVTRLFNV